MKGSRPHQVARMSHCLGRILSFTVPSGFWFKPEGHLQRGRNFSLTVFCTETWRKNLQEQIPWSRGYLGDTNHHQNQTFKMHLFSSIYLSSFFSTFSLSMLIGRDQRIFIHKALLGHLTKLILKLIYHRSHIKIISLTHGQKDVSLKWLFFSINGESSIHSLSPI